VLLLVFSAVTKQKQDAHLLHNALYQLEMSICVTSSSLLTYYRQVLCMGTLWQCKEWHGDGDCATTMEMDIKIAVYLRGWGRMLR